MRDEEKLSDDLNELAEALAGLAPNESCLSRDRLMYEGGQAAALSAGPFVIASRWAWPAATAVSTLAATVLGVLLALPGEPQVVERVVYVEGVRDPLDTQQPKSVRDSTPKQTELETMPPDDELLASARRRMFWLPDDPSQGNNYLALRAMVLTRGVDALPRRDLTHVADYRPQHSPSVRELLREQLPEFRTRRSIERRVREKPPSSPNNRTGRTTSGVVFPT